MISVRRDGVKYLLPITFLCFSELGRFVPPCFGAIMNKLTYTRSLTIYLFHWKNSEACFFFSKISFHDFNKNPNFIYPYWLCTNMCVPVDGRSKWIMFLTNWVKTVRQPYRVLIALFIVSVFFYGTDLHGRIGNMGQESVCEKVFEAGSLDRKSSEIPGTWRPNGCSLRYQTRK